MSEALLYPFPKLADLRGEFRDHIIEDNTYFNAKHLYETRQCKLIGDRYEVSTYHKRECVQLALCDAIRRRNAAATFKDKKYDQHSK